MARLINDFFEQRQKLVKEIEERIEAEKKLMVTEEDLKHSLNEKEVLIKEIHHRVKNNLQIIISLIRIQTGKIDDPVMIGHLNTTLNRIKSISLVHELLYRSGDLSRIDLNTYISQFTASLKEIYLSSSRRISIEVSVNDIFLGVEKAIPCGVIINELVTNSLKHAFSGQNCGVIKISMERSDGLITLKVSDNGIGIRKDFDIEDSGSLGMFLLQSLSKQIDAEFEIESENGTTVTLRFNEEHTSSIKPKNVIKAAIPIIYRNKAVLVN
jgi:two-component sensor histidine kinase